MVAQDIDIKEILKKVWNFYFIFLYDEKDENQIREMARVIYDMYGHVRDIFPDPLESAISRLCNTAYPSMGMRKLTRKEAFEIFKKLETIDDGQSKIDI